MKNDPRTSDDIERDIVHERAQMSDTLNDLQKKFSVDAIMSDLGGMFRGQGGTFGRAITDTVGRNPAAVALVGVGLAWLLLGQDRTTTGSSARRHNIAPSGRPSERALPNSRSGTGHSPAYGMDGSFDSDRYWYDDRQTQDDDRLKDRETGSWASDAGVSDSGNGMTGRVRGAASAVGHAVSDAAVGVGSVASDLSERLSHGLDDLTEDARSRIVAARRAAHEARQASVAMLNRGSRAATGLFEDQPLVIGALAVAVGAAIGSVLPHSKLEDDTMGDSSDRLFAEAQALYHQERDKAAAALRTAASDAKAEIRNIGDDLADLLPDDKTIGDVIVDRASDAATRVVQHATGDDEHQKRDPLAT